MKQLHQEIEEAAPPAGTKGASVQDIVCISSIDWDFIWQGHQQIMSTLAEQGNRVLFIENTGIRSVTLSDTPRLKKRLMRWLKSVRGFRQEMPNLYVYSPLGLPFPYSRLARWINRWMILQDLRRWMKVVQFGNPVVWTFLPTPLAMNLIDAINPQAVIYYCIDNFAASSPAARKIRRAESQMFRKADLVFVTSHQLKDYASAHSKKVHLFPFGVDYETFEKHREGPQRPEPADIARIPRPRAGYVGGIHQWVDLNLLKETARLCPDLQFVLIGPVQTDIRPIRGIGNIHLLGTKPHESLPDYIRCFDAGIIPYRLTDYTDNVYPTKTNEYLAMGKPVVSTPLKEIMLFNQTHGETIRIAASPEEFGGRIRESIRHHDAGRLTAIARENGWLSRIQKMTELIDRTIQERAAGRQLRWREQFIDFTRTAQRRVIKSVVGAAALVGLLLYTPLPWWAASPLKISEPPRPADAIVVLGGGVGESGKAGQGYEERVQQAVALYRRGLAGKILFSSGYIHIFHEPEVMKALAVSLGVPASDILLETEAANTRENALQVAEIASANGWQSILLVSSPYHMRRAELTFAKQKPQLNVISVPVDNSLFYARKRIGMTWEQLLGILHEYLALVYYRLKRWI
ncbi:MAG: YdcF family protein [Candidatus Omnitrophica bacterium]|nr:YdcF family protein [Candidatus Omnitrophota bacterium]